MDKAMLIVKKTNQVEKTTCAWVLSLEYVWGMV